MVKKPKITAFYNDHEIDVDSDEIIDCEVIKAQFHKCDCHIHCHECEGD